LSVKVRVLKLYGGCRCACCGETEIIFLTLDHVKNDGKVRRKARPSGFAWYLRLLRLPEKGLQVLCYNCNIGKHKNGGVCPHVKRAARWTLHNVTL
jgi:hypothetical protein